MSLNGKNAKERQRITAALCAAMPDAPTRQLARTLHAKHKRWFPSIEIARSAVRAFLGQNGKGTAKIAKARGVYREPIKPLPKSQARTWEPFALIGKKIGVISDLHLPYHDEQAIEAALDDLEKRDIDTLLINGDLLDFYQLSRFDKSPNRPGVDAELEACSEFLEHVRGRFPKARIVWKLGNHEERWEIQLSNNCPAMFNVAKFAWTLIAGVEEFNVEVVSDRRPIMAGKLPILHGHEMGKGGVAAPVNPARGAFLRTHHTILVGHSHQTSGHADTNLWHNETFCWSTGCLCQLTPDYAPVNRWNHGFAYIEVAKDGSFGVNNLRISNGVVRQS